MNTFFFNPSCEFFYDHYRDGCTMTIVCDRDLDSFEDDYELARKEGNSIIDSLEIAKGGLYGRNL